MWPQINVHCYLTWKLHHQIRYFSDAVYFKVRTVRISNVHTILNRLQPLTYAVFSALIQDSYKLSKSVTKIAKTQQEMS